MGHHQLYIRCNKNNPNKMEFFYGVFKESSSIIIEKFCYDIVGHPYINQQLLTDRILFHIFLS